MVAHTSFCVLTAALLLARQPAPDPELAYAEKVLREGNVTPDGASLMRFFRARTLTEAERKRLPDKVELLGAEDFAVREQASRDLINAGRWSIPYLKAAAEDRDLERARRARDCLAAVEGWAE